MDAPVPYIQYQDVQLSWSHLRDGHLSTLPLDVMETAEGIIKQFERHLGQYKAMTAKCRLEFDDYPPQADSWSLGGPGQLQDIYTRMERSLLAAGHKPTKEFYLLILRLALLLGVQMRGDAERGIEYYALAAKSYEDPDEVLGVLEPKLHVLPSDWIRTDTSPVMKTVAAAVRAVAKDAKDAPVALYKLAIQYALLAAKHDADTASHYYFCGRTLSKTIEDGQIASRYPRVCRLPAEPTSQD